VQIIQRRQHRAANPEAQSASASTFLESSFPVLGEVHKPIPHTLSQQRLSEPDVLPSSPVANAVQEQVVFTKKKRPDKFLSVNLEQLIERTAKNKVIASKAKKFKIKRVIVEEKLSGNPLDSSQPKRHRGKVREIPKKKRKSALKLVILSYRYAMSNI
jgi:hypothetical protein